MFWVIKMIIHTVEKGDSLYSIGRHYGVTIEQLLKANGPTVEPTLIIGQAVIIPTEQNNKPQKIINGYAYPNINRFMLQAALPTLSNISPFSHGINDDGTLMPLADDDMIAIADSAGVSPILIVTTLNQNGFFSSQRAVDVLSNDEFEQNLINSILQELQNHDYFGVDIDFEYIPPEYKSSYPQFIKNLKDAISPLGYKVFVSLAPKTSAMQRGLLYEAHDYKALGEVADYVLIMTYEWGYTYGPPMAIAPIDKVREVLQYAVTEIPNEKVLMGVPNYAYDWTLPFEMGSKAESMTNDEAISRARKFGAEIKFDSQAATPYYTYYNGRDEHIVWFEDARSVNARVNLINELGLAGLSIWNIMNAYIPLLNVINSNFYPMR